MEPYVRPVQYYETDMMGVAHHANYLHWSPVVEIACRYRKSCTFGDVISISVEVESFSPAKMTLTYEMRDRKGDLVCTARSEHTFLDREGRIVRIRRVMPEFCEAIEKLMEEKPFPDNNDF